MTWSHTLALMAASNGDFEVECPLCEYHGPPFVDEFQTVYLLECPCCQLQWLVIKE